MDETKLYSWFLGPKAENADLLERLVLEALRDCVFWRRNFHPEDDIIITEKVKREDAFQDSLALVRQEFLTLLANLKRDVPFYSPRYIGHMLGDQLLPAIAAYFAAMLHNPNNVTRRKSRLHRRVRRRVEAGHSIFGHLKRKGSKGQRPPCPFDPLTLCVEFFIHPCGSGGRRGPWRFHCRPLPGSARSLFVCPASGPPGWRTRRRRRSWSGSRGDAALSPALRRASRLQGFLRFASAVPRPGR